MRSLILLFAVAPTLAVAQVPAPWAPAPVTATPQAPSSSPYFAPAPESLPAPSRARSDLLWRGVRNRRIGSTLIGVGAGTLVAGAITTGLAYTCFSSVYYDPVWNTYYSTGGPCNVDDGLLIAGGVTAGVGGAVLLSGIITYAVGQSQLDRIRIGVQPERSGASGQLGIRF